MKGKTVNYVNNTAVDLQFPDLITGTPSYITVSDAFVYARNKVNKVGTTNKFHGGYQIFGQKLAMYFEVPLQAPERTDWTRSMITDIPSKELLVYREHVASGIIRLEE